MSKVIVMNPGTGWSWAVASRLLDSITTVTGVVMAGDTVDARPGRS